MESLNSAADTEAQNRIAAFSIGFLKLSISNGEEDAVSAGSGTLVTIGSVSGILTAAHVLDGLPDNEMIGLVRFPVLGSVVQNLKFDISYAQKISIGSAPFTDKGPDLGFLKLPSDVVGSLKARGNIFFNLDKRREAVVSGQYTKRPYFDCVAGVIAERTKELPEILPNTRRKGFEASMELGFTTVIEPTQHIDLFEFDLRPDQDSKVPTNYEGVSGGGLWRIFCTKADDGTLLFADLWVLGVAFYQSAVVNNKRKLIGHGPKSVYQTLADAVRSRWPV